MRASWLLIGLLACGTEKPGDVRRPPESDPDTDGSTDPGTPEDPDTDPEVTPPDITPEDETPLPPPPFLDLAVVADLTDDIDDILSGTVHSVRIVDAENGEVVYESDATVPRTPASNTKLFTTAAAMDALGEDHRFRSRAYAPAKPDASGKVASLTVLVEHDSTWSDFVYADEFFAADRLADALYDAGVRQVTGTLTFSGEVLVDGYSLGTWDEELHRDLGVDVVVDALAGRGITVAKTAVSSSLSVPAGVLLAERESPPLSVVAHPINVYSHNEMADILAHHNGWELDGDSSYAGGEVAVLDLLVDLGIDTSDVNFQDGSGLSHGNDVSAAVVSDMILGMMARPAGQAWERTFAIAGVLGTIDYRMTGDDTWGRVYAKTGSLYNVIALSGVLYNRYDGHRYVFSILQDDVPDQTAARATADDVVERIAQDLRGGGVRPGSAVLKRVTNAGNGSVDVEWGAVPDAEAYGVWTSTDGLVWDRADAVVETGTTHTLTGLPADVPVYVRVTAYNDTGEGEPSDVYAATPSSSGSRVLVVDGNDRWALQWENTRGAGHDFVRSVVEAMPGRTVDTVANEELPDLSDYDAVIWLSGEESSDDVTFDAAERDAIDAYLDGGGSLLVSGGELGWDLDHLGDADAAAFYNGSLHASYVGDDAGTFSVGPVAGGLFDGVGELGFYTPARLVVDFPDQIAPMNGAKAQLTYLGGAGGTAAVSYDGAYEVVNLGFPIESIDGVDTRSAVLDRILDFFGV